MEDINEAPECDDPRGDIPSYGSMQELSSENRNFLSKEDLLLAATYVEDARLGRHSYFKSSGSQLRLYRLYNHPAGKIALTFILLLHIMLALFEKPAVSGLHLSVWVLISIEFFIILCYTIRLLHIRSFTTVTRFWSDTKNIILVILIMFCLTDMIIYIALIHSGYSWIRISRPLRPLFIINFPEMRQIRRSFRNLRRTLPDVFNVLVLLFFSLSIFALMAFKLFGNRNLLMVDGRPYFDTYWNSMFDLYVLITTANNPDIMMPAFDANMWYVLFFIVFLILCFFIYMNIILAVIYNNYRKNLKDLTLDQSIWMLGQNRMMYRTLPYRMDEGDNPRIIRLANQNEVKKSIIFKRLQLSRAFDLLATSSEGSTPRKTVTKQRFQELMKILCLTKSEALINVLWIVLDTENCNNIDKTDFLKLADLLNVEVREVVNKRIQFARWFPRFYDSQFSVGLRKIICHKYFRYLFDLLTVANAIVIGISNSASTWDDPVEWIFISLFITEILFKLYALGGRKFFSRMWNVFDFFVIGAAFFLGVIEQISDGVKESRLTLDVLLVLRVLRLVKLVGSVKRFKVIFLTINKILPSLVTYGSVMLVIYYMFAIVGMEIFGGKVQYLGYDSPNFCGNPKLNGTDFWIEHYCNNNFNDLLHALIVMVELTVVNQWHVIAYGYSNITNHFARIYFMAFHLVCVLVVLNIFTAFVLEVFILEYCARQGLLESEVERKIHEMGLSTKSDRLRRASTLSNQDLVPTDAESSDDDDMETGSVETDGNTIRRASCMGDRSQDTNVRFHISKKIRSVEVLLQKLFENELIAEFDFDLDNIDLWNSDKDLFRLKSNWTMP